MDYEISFLPEQQQSEVPTETGIIKGALKTAARAPFRAAETALGYAGDLGNAVSKGLNYLNPYGLTPEEHEMARQSKQGLPTSSELKQKVQEHLPWTKPEKGSYGEMADNVVETFTSLVLPDVLSKGYKIGSVAKRAAAAAIGSEFAGWTSKELGASEGGQAAVKLGTLVGMSLAGGRAKVREQASQSYKTARELATDAERVNATGLQSKVGDLANNLKEGTHTEAKSWFKPHLDLIKGKIKNGKMGVNDAVQTVQDLRGELRDGNVPYRAQHFAHELINSLKTQVIDPYGKLNKDFGKTFGAAEQAWSALHKDSIFTKFINEHLSHNKFASSIARGLFHTGVAAAAHGAGGISKAIPAVGATLGVREGYKLIDLLHKSTIAQDVYGKMFKAIAAGNVGVATKLASKFDSVAEKYEKKHPDPDTQGEWEITKI